MSNQQIALRLALEALNTTESDCGSRAWEREQEAITALREALAEQPAPAITPEHLLALAQTASLELDKVIAAFQMAAPVQQEPVTLEEYDAGILNDFGGGNVEWWQDYIRAELGRAYEHYQSQMATPQLPAQQQEPVTHQYQGRDGAWRDFINENHYKDTLEDGSWPIRDLYTSPPPQPERVRELECVIADLKAECQAIRAKQPTAEESSVVQPAPVPEGWKLVPVEPTDEMLDAAQFVVTDIYRVDVDRVYAAMLRNAPEKGQP